MNVSINKKKSNMSNKKLMQLNRNGLKPFSLLHSGKLFVFKHKALLNVNYISDEMDYNTQMFQ